MQGLPDGQARVGRRVPVGGILRPLQQADVAAAANRHAGLLHAVHAGALGAGQRVGFAELAVLPAVLLEPVQAELGVVVEVVLGEEAVDELQGGPHAHRRAVGFQHGGVLREDGHAGADDRLRQVHRRDGRMLVAAPLVISSRASGSTCVQLAQELRGGKSSARQSAAGGRRG